MAFITADKGGRLLLIYIVCYSSYSFFFLLFPDFLYAPTIYQSPKVYTSNILKTTLKENGLNLLLDLHAEHRHQGRESHMWDEHTEYAVSDEVLWPLGSESHVSSLSV